MTVQNCTVSQMPFITSYEYQSQSPVPVDFFQFPCVAQARVHMFWKLEHFGVFSISAAFAHVRCIFVDDQWFSLFLMNQRDSFRYVLAFFVRLSRSSWTLCGYPRLSPVAISWFPVFLVCAGRASPVSPGVPSFLVYLWSNLQVFEHCIFCCILCNMCKM